jgi:hypothetical protein
VAEMVGRNPSGRIVVCCFRLDTLDRGERIIANTFSIVMGSVMLAILSKGSHGQPVDIFALSSYVKSFFSATLAANFVATGLLALRIWQVHHRTGGTSGPISEAVLYRLGRVLVDSGMLYSATLLITLILFACNSNAQYILVDCVRMISLILLH